MHFHLQRDKRKEGIAGALSGYDLHRFGPAFKLFIQPFYDIACPQADPFIFREMEKCQTLCDGSLEAFNGRRHKKIGISFLGLHQILHNFPQYPPTYLLK